MAAHQGVKRLALLPLFIACTQASAPPASVGNDGETAAPSNTALPAAATGATQGCEKSTALQVLSHDIELDVSLDPPSLTGKGRLRVKATEPTSAVVLDAKELTVSRFVVESQELDFERTSGLVCARLSDPLSVGGERTLQLEWRASTGQFTPKFSKNEVWAGYQASAWMPTVQDAAQRATLSLQIIAKETLKVGASGRLQERQSLPGGRTRHSFVLDRPSPPFLYAFAVGGFDSAELRVDDMLLRAFGPPGADMTAALQVTGSMYRFLNSTLGVPHPWGEYLQVFVGEDAAQEAAGMALIGAQALKDLRVNPQDDWVFMHELAHQWFGWLVSCADFADFWLNEGFATFMVGAFKQSRWGAAAYEEELANWRKRSAKAHAEERGAPVALSSPTGARRVAPQESDLQDRGITYFRGALVLHRLRAELGEEPFWQGIRAYLTSRAGKGARTLDLRRAFEAASQRDLGKFFEQWVYTPAVVP